jgi:predicted nucleic acid-binding protein
VILLDTVVLSETRKARANPAVIAYLREHAMARTFISVLSIGEITQGIERQRHVNPGFALELSSWLDNLERQFASTILPVTPSIAKIWGNICAQTGNQSPDNMIAATALHHDLTVVTRNVKHFEATGVRVINPFAAL